VTHSNGGKFVNTAATSLNAEYNCSGISKFFFFVFFVLYNGLGEKTGKKEYQRKNFDIPLQLYSALRQVAAVLTNFPPYG
jgi:hypothetical protein